MSKDEWYKQLFERLGNSRFRSRFHLKQNDIDYIHEKGLDTIRKHAEDFITKREAPAYIPNDGKQTPMRGHPVFIAQHATATCCRECIRKWHKIQPGRELSQVQQEPAPSSWRRSSATWLQALSLLKGGFNYMKRKRISFLTMLMLAVILLMPASIFACA